MDILSFRPALSPFVKWAGGKRQLLPAIARRMPGQFRITMSRSSAAGPSS